MHSLKLEDGLFERVNWIVKLRWIAIAGLFFTVFSASNVFKISLPLAGLYSISILLAICNLLFKLCLVYLKRKQLTNINRITNRIANGQISFDLIILALLIHLSGGIENPFLFYFIFHMIIAGILLSRRAAMFQAAFAVFLFFNVVLFEYLGVLPHYCLKGFIAVDLHDNIVYIMGIGFVFISTLYIAVYMASSISITLRKREKSLREVNELLLEKDRIKSEYVMRVSHDIKEHLAAIQSCIEPVTGGITGPLNDQQISLLNRADTRTQKLMFFVKALLESTRIKLSRKMDVEYFSFKDMLTDVINNIIPKAKNKGIVLESGISPDIGTVRGNREYIREAVSNLLMNSVKYTAPNGRVSIDAVDKGNSIFISIKDTGIGIPKDEISHIFDEFFRASNARQLERDGTGMGVSIAKQIVERHNGKIWVESVEGKGTSFFIILPK